LTWAVVEFDAGSEFNLGASRFVSTAGGKYSMHAAAHVITLGTGTTEVKLHLYKNGVLLKTLQQVIALAGLTDITLTGSVICTASPTDYFEVFAEFVGLTSGSGTVDGTIAATWFSGAAV
jgi:hypothetical protein